MDEIKSIISKVIGNISSKKADHQNKIFRLWENILNPQELKHAKIEGMKDGILNIIVDSPAWLFQMKLRKNKILTRLKEEDVDIKILKLKIGKVK